MECNKDMCLILIGEALSLINKSDWLYCTEQSNPHGIGLYNVTQDRLVKRIKNTNQALKRLKAFKHDDQIIMHYRYATKGLVSQSNIHPFKLKDGSIFAHNGTVSKTRLLKASEGCELKTAFIHSHYNNEALSDSRLISLLLETMPDQDRRLYIQALSDLSGSRFVYTHNGILSLYGDWLSEDNILLSNDNYHKPLWEDLDPSECLECEAPLDPNWFYCPICGCEALTEWSI